MQASGIKKLGGVFANVGVKPPRLGEEQALVGCDRLLAVKQMVQRRHVRTLGMTALHRLFKLLGIAYQYDAPRSLRYRQNIRQRHLGRFVDEQNVDRVGSIWGGPKPRCSTGHVAAVSNGVEQDGIGPSQTATAAGQVPFR